MGTSLLRPVFSDRLAHMEEVGFENASVLSQDITKADHKLHYSKSQGFSSGSCGSGQTQEIATDYGCIYAHCSLRRQAQVVKGT